MGMQFKIEGHILSGIMLIDLEVNSEIHINFFFFFCECRSEK